MRTTQFVPAGRFAGFVIQLLAVAQLVNGAAFASWNPALFHFARSYGSAGRVWEGGFASPVVPGYEPPSTWDVLAMVVKAFASP